MSLVPVIITFTRFILRFWPSDAHLAESVIVMSDTSILRQFSTLSRTGLLTCVCVWEGQKHIRVQSNKTFKLAILSEKGKVSLPSSQTEKVCSSACIFHPAEGRCTAWYRSSDEEEKRGHDVEFICSSCSSKEKLQINANLSCRLQEST